MPNNIIANEDDISSSAILWQFIKIALPTTIGTFFCMFQETINLYVIGLYNDPRKLSGVGMGNMIINMTGTCMYYGLNSGLETLLSQARGTNNPRFYGVLLQRARFLACCLYVPIFAIWTCSYFFLNKLGQDPIVMKYAYYYILAFLPGQLFLGLGDV